MLGADLFETLIASVWPLWDLTLGLVLFVDDEPKFISSCVMDVFRATNRNDVKRVPPLHTTDWYHYAVNERTLPKVATSGRVTVVFLGERPTPHHFAPLEPDELAALPIGSDGTDLFKAGAEAATPSRMQACCLRHDGYVLAQTRTVPNALGYEKDDTDWIPKDWFIPLQPGPPETGFSAVRMNATSDTEPKDATLRWTRLRLGEFNLYSVKKLDAAATVDPDQTVQVLIPGPKA